MKMAGLHKPRHVASRARFCTEGGQRPLVQNRLPAGPEWLETARRVTFESASPSLVASNFACLGTEGEGGNNGEGGRGVREGS